MSELSREDLIKLKEQKEEDLDNAKAQLNAIVGQILLLNDLINPKTKEEKK